MPVILDVMPENTYRRMMTPELAAELATLGTIVACRNARELTEEAYGDLWEQADAVLSGWGVRPPTVAILDRAVNLKVISHTAGSVRMFPRYALEKGVVITTARSAIARSVAEFCLMNTLTLLRRQLYYVDADPARKAFLSPDGTKPYSQTLFGKTVGLIGYGVIARYFRTMLAPFQCRVLVTDPYLTQTEADQQQVERVELTPLLSEAQVVSLHAPELPTTHQMIGAPELALLKDGNVFLNAARGRLVDTQALTATLQTGRIFAAIDVTDPEPLPPDHPLRSLPNVLFTPHIAGPTEDDLPHLTRTALADLARVLRGDPPLYPITPEAYDIMSF
ncbi:MAG: 2-hydroxyacid dehydrogenase [Chthonomonadales bacterium]|nr:2-hydroxyacid dehydrogenase [Chthonomonadales bacterium]